MANYEFVEHPTHYNKEGKAECWVEMEDIFGPDAVAIFDMLNAFKYYYRFGAKPGNDMSQDVAKLKAYVQHGTDILCDTCLTTPGTLTPSTKLALKCRQKLQEVING